MLFQRLSLCVGIALLATTELLSAPMPVPGLTGVTFDLFEQEFSVTLTLAGGPVNNSEMRVFPGVFTFQGDDWKFRTTFNLVNDPAGDTVSLVVRLFHDDQPHGVARDDGAGATIAFSGMGSTSAPVGAQGWVFTGIPDIKTHGQDQDRYSITNRLIISAPGMPNQIQNWSVEITGKHTPESGALIYVGSGLICIAMLLKRINAL